jgi:hypothetical protein
MVRVDLGTPAQKTPPYYFRWLRWRWYLASERDLVTAWSMKALVEAREEGEAEIDSRGWLTDTGLV